MSNPLYPDLALLQVIRWPCIFFYFMLPSGTSTVACTCMTPLKVRISSCIEDGWHSRRENFSRNAFFSRITNRIQPWQQKNLPQNELEIPIPLHDSLSYPTSVSSSPGHNHCCSGKSHLCTVSRETVSNTFTIRHWSNHGPAAYGSSER